jgi:hypothetical protein
MGDGLISRWRDMPGWLRIAISVAGILVTGVVLLVFAISLLLIVSYFLNTKVSDRVAFVTANLLNVLIFGAIMLQAGIYLVQADIYKQQRDIMQRQMDNFEITERAYIGIRRMRLIGLDEGFKQLAVQVTFRNGGKSPAFKFKPCAEVSVGDVPRPFTWREVTPDIKRSFIPGSEDRSIVVPYFGVVDDPSTILGQKPTKQVFIDGEARYETLGGKEIILCFGGSYVVGEELFESRYQYEREAKPENSN